MNRITIDARTIEQTADPIFTNPLRVPPIYIATCTDERNRNDYQRDCAFFETHRDRRFHLRQAGMEEFADVPNVSDYAQLPERTTLVCQLCVGVHLCMFVYYGKTYRNVTVKSDTDVAQLLSRMSSEQGLALEEFTEFATAVGRNTLMLQNAMNSNPQKAN